jgi:glycosyltransferase involved in cell wall biosynthesis
MKTNLIFVDGTFPGGGAQQALMRYKNNFSEIENINTFYFPVGKLSQCSHLAQDDVLFSCNQGRIKRLLLLANFIRRAPRTVLFVTSIGSFFAMLPLYLVLRSKTKLIYRYIQLPSQQIKASLVPKYSWILLSLFRDFPDLYIAQTSEMEEEMVSLLGMDPSKMTVIGNWISDPELYNQAPDVIPYSAGSIVTFGVLGRIVKEKGLVDILKALKICVDNKHDFQLHIYGADIGGYKQILIQEIARLDLSNRVKFFAYQKDIVYVMRRCDVILNASYAEGYPNILIEALALGKKVIFSRSVSVVRELLERVNTGKTFDIGDYKQLSSHMMSWQDIKERKYLVSKSDYNFDTLFDTILND